MRHLHCIPLIILLLSASQSFTGCTEQSRIETVLDKAEDIMETENPAKVYAMLDSIDTAELRHRRLKARYALLYSQALDKNYIDLATDSIIRPAVKYYRHHGSAEDKLKTLYYLGRIKKNAGDNEGAMRCYIKAEKYADDNDNHLMSGRLFNAKKGIYYRLNLFHTAKDNALKAAEHYKKANDMSRYAKELSNAVNIFQVLGDTTNTLRYLDTLKTLTTFMNTSAKSVYYNAYLDAVAKDSTNLTSRIIKDYINAVQDTSLIDWLSIAKAYYYKNEQDSALRALALYPYSNPNYLNEQRYLLLCSYIYKEKGQINKAYDYLLQYIDTDTFERQLIYNDETKYEDERYYAELKSMKLIFTLIVTVLSTIIIGLVSILAIRKIKKRRMLVEAENVSLEKTNATLQNITQNLETSFELLKSENDNLTIKYANVIADFNQKELKNYELRTQIEGRISLFHKLIASYITNDGLSKSLEKELNSLVADRETLLKNLRNYFSVMYPSFTSYLVDKGLKEREIDICHLHLLGLRGKEIGNYLNLSRHYSISSDIRKKLGLTEHDTNIGLYLFILRDQLCKTS